MHHRGAFVTFQNGAFKQRAPNSPLTAVNPQRKWVRRLGRNKKSLRRTDRDGRCAPKLGSVRFNQVETRPPWVIGVAIAFILAMFQSQGIWNVYVGHGIRACTIDVNPHNGAVGPLFRSDPLDAHGSHVHVAQPLVKGMNTGNFAGYHAAQAQHPVAHHRVSTQSPVARAIVLLWHWRRQTLRGWIPYSAFAQQVGR